MLKHSLLVVCMFWLFPAFASDSPAPRKTDLSDTPYVKVDSMWVEYDVKVDNVLGMRIHFTFTAYNMKDIDGFLAIYFEYDDEYGGFLRDKNNKYVSSSGDVAVYRTIRPAYAAAVFKDFQMFMPYDELDLEPGSYELAMDAKIIRKEGGILAPIKWHYFTYREPAK